MKTSLPHLCRIVGSAAFLVLALWVGGCAQTDVAVSTYLSDALPFPSRPGTRVAVVTDAPATTPLLRRELQRKIEYLLQERGFLKAAPTATDYVLAARATIDQGHEVLDSYDVQHSFPQRTTSLYMQRGRRVYVRRYHPIYVERRYYTYTEYTKSLELTLIDPTRQQTLPPRDRDDAIVWQAGAVTTDTESDLRQAADFLLVGAFKYFGIDTGGTETVTLGEHDERVTELREALGRVGPPTSDAKADDRR